MIRPSRIFAVLLLLAAPAIAQEAPATEPTTRRAMTKQQRADQLVEFLNSEYADLLKSPDWIERSLAAISLARLPGDHATDQLIGLMKKDPLPVVKIVAWQAVLSRAKFLTNAQYQAWVDATGPLANKNLFRGTTRVGLLRQLAIEPPSRPAKLAFVGIFGQTNAYEPSDLPVLDALGDCLAAWHTPDLGEYTFNRLGNLNDAYRAEYVLHRAGFDLPWAGEHMDLGSSAMWKLTIDNDQAALRRSKSNWTPLKTPEPEAWKKLAAQYVPSTDLDTPVDPDDPDWRRETELGRVDPKPLDVVFVVDATGSMQATLDSLKANIAQIKLSLELVANHPRLGVTFYRDQGDEFVTRSTPLTDKLNQLDAFLGTVDAHGGGDRPEAVLDALLDAFKKNPWHDEGNARKILILLTDAPPHPQTQEDCVTLVKAARDKGFTLQIMKVRSTEDQSDLTALDELATASGTDPMWSPLADHGAFRFELPTKHDRESIDATRVAYAPPPDAAERQILKRLLTTSINPKFADRVEPLVDIILALTTPGTPEKRLPFGVPEGPTNDAGVDMGHHDPQDR